jgi:tRNA(Ile)-lysidine synthase
MLTREVFNFIQENKLIDPRDAVVVGVSGGPDSVCLLHILWALGYKVHVAYLDHRLREEAGAEADFVTEFAQKFDLPITLGSANVKEHKYQSHLSLEESARELRYEFLMAVAHSVGATKIAVGHTASDQVETLLLQLIRGTGSLKGMDACIEYHGGMKVVRPLLQIKREEVLEYLEGQHLTYQIDHSNLSPTFLRNRVRWELIPLLKDYNPRMEEALVRLSHILRDESSFLEGEVDRIYGQLVQKEEGRVILSQALSHLHPALVRRLIRRAMYETGGSLRDVELKHIEEVRKALSWNPGRKLCLPHGFTLLTRRKGVVVERRGGQA